jgi:hypothetical protein
VQPVHSRDSHSNSNTSSSVHQPTSIIVRTKYKPKSSKVVPVKQSDGSTSGGTANWLFNVNSSHPTYYLVLMMPGFWITPKFSSIICGSRLTSARLLMMKIGEHLLPAEHDLLKVLLFNREAALAWTMEGKG